MSQIFILWRSSSPNVNTIETVDAARPKGWTEALLKAAKRYEDTPVGTGIWVEVKAYNALMMLYRPDEPLLPADTNGGDMNKADADCSDCGDKSGVKPRGCSPYWLSLRSGRQCRGLSFMRCARNTEHGMRPCCARVWSGRRSMKWPWTRKEWSGSG